MRWKLPDPVDPQQAQALARELDLPLPCAELLVRRGHTTLESAMRFLEPKLADLPDPFSMLGMETAVARLARAVKSRERVVLFGDYDVDGVTSTALMRSVLAALGLETESYIPHRLDEGYGLNIPAVTALAERGPGLLIALDCGVTAVAEVEHAVKLGFEVLVVDHHTTPAVLPPAVAILNPHQPGCGYPTKALCAAGVAFQLLLGLRKRLREEGFFMGGRTEPNLRHSLDLVALATVADVVPLVGANRVLVKHGLEVLSQGLRPGVRALKEVAGLKAGEVVNAGQVGFRLGPRINAAGRLGAAMEAVELLTTTDEPRARALAEQLDVQNKERQTIERRMLDEALALATEQAAAGERGIVVAGEGWHAGVVGIVAARIVDKLHRPAVVIALKDGVGKGSARSIEAFHMYDALAAASGPLDRFGGHKHAAGITVQAERLEAFRTAFQALARERLRDEALTKRVRVDSVLPLGSIDLRFVEQLDRLAPFGAGNPRPTFLSSFQPGGMRILASKGEGPGHLKLTAGSQPGALPAIGFGLAELSAHCGAPVDAAFRVGLDTWNGHRRPQLELEHLWPKEG